MVAGILSLQALQYLMDDHVLSAEPYMSQTESGHRYGKVPARWFLHWYNPGKQRLLPAFQQELAFFSVTDPDF